MRELDLQKAKTMDKSKQKEILKSPLNQQKIKEECLLRWGKFVILHADYYQAGLKTCKSACWLRGSLAGLRTFQACRSRFLII